MNEAEKVRYLMRQMREGRSERRQRALRPTFLRDILSRYPDGYQRRRPSPLMALLKDLSLAIEKLPKKKAK